MTVGATAYGNTEAIAATGGQTKPIVPFSTSLVIVLQHAAVLTTSKQTMKTDFPPDDPWGNLLRSVHNATQATEHATDNRISVCTILIDRQVCKPTE